MLWYWLFHINLCNKIKIIIHPATREVITTLAIKSPSYFISVPKSLSSLNMIMCIKVKIVVKDSTKTKIYVKVTVGLTAVFYLTVGIKAIKDTNKAEMFSIIFPVYWLFW